LRKFWRRMASPCSRKGESGCSTRELGSKLGSISACHAEIAVDRQRLVRKLGAVPAKTALARLDSSPSAETCNGFLRLLRYSSNDLRPASVCRSRVWGTFQRLGCRLLDVTNLLQLGSSDGGCGCAMGEVVDCVARADG
jgi:hypothetical protein